MLLKVMFLKNKVSEVVRSELNLLVGEVIRPLLNDIRCRFAEMKIQQEQTALTANDVVRDIVCQMTNLHKENALLTGSVETELLNVHQTQQQQHQALQSVDETMNKNFSVADRIIAEQQARLDPIDTRTIRSRTIRMKVDPTSSDPSSSSSSVPPCDSNPIVRTSVEMPCEANFSQSLPPRLPCEVNQVAHSPSEVPCEVNNLSYSPSRSPNAVPSSSSVLHPPTSQHYAPYPNLSSSHPTPSVHYDSRLPLAADRDHAFGDRIPSSLAYPMIPMKLIPPPEFSSIRYATWKKEVGYWRELYSYVSEGQILCALGLTASSELKRILMHFMKKTRDTPQSRTLKNILIVLDENYAISSREREMVAMEKLSQLMKEPNESYQIFWHRYETVMDSLESSRESLGEEFLFMRCLKALNLLA